MRVFASVVSPGILQDHIAVVDAIEQGYGSAPAGLEDRLPDTGVRVIAAETPPNAQPDGRTTFEARCWVRPL